MIKANDPSIPRERAIRLYKESPEGWDLQLRAPIGLGSFGGRDGKDFIVASASLSLDDMRALHLALGDMIADALADVALRGCCGESETGSGEHGEECPEARS